MRLNFPKLATLLTILLFVLAGSAFAQSAGRLSGNVTDPDGKPVAGVIVVATNQTSTDETLRRTGSDGSYSFRLRGGAYRINVRAPYEARFDRGKMSDYGAFTDDQDYNGKSSELATGFSGNMKLKKADVMAPCLAERFSGTHGCLPHPTFGHPLHHQMERGWG